MGCTIVPADAQLRTFASLGFADLGARFWFEDYNGWVWEGRIRSIEHGMAHGEHLVSVRCTDPGMLLDQDPADTCWVLCDPFPAPVAADRVYGRSMIVVSPGPVDGKEQEDTVA